MERNLSQKKQDRRLLFPTGAVRSIRGKWDKTRTGTRKRRRGSVKVREVIKMKVSRTMFLR